MLLERLLVIPEKSLSKSLNRPGKVLAFINYGSEAGIRFDFAGHKKAKTLSSVPHQSKREGDICLKTPLFAE